jgi:sodium-dependent phosphate cotransporter
MQKKLPQTILKISLVFFFLYLFLVSIGLMSVAFKGFGKDFAEELIKTTSNPFVGLFIGILTTSIVQSSSTITSIVVGMVGSKVLTIGNAIPIIMGANIGTTVTNTLVSLGHITRREEFKRAVSGATVHDFFNIICVLIMFPLELTTHFLQRSASFLSDLFIHNGGIKFTSPIKYATKPLIHLIKKMVFSLHSLHIISYILLLILAIILLFTSLYFIVKLMRSLIVKRAEIVLGNVMGHGSLGILAGFLFTTLVQSSSITTSLLVPLVASGIMTVEIIFPITLGANIGTTTTAILASLAAGNTPAITVAFVHFLFNFIGVFFIYPVKIFRRIPISLAKGLGNLAFRRRRYILVYVLCVFFLLPGILILISTYIFK